MWTNIDVIDLEKHQAFVYLVTCNDTGDMYLGKKNLFTTRRLPPLKGKKRKRVVVKESDWKTYQGSSEVSKTWKNVTKTILVPCKLKGEATYHEVRLMFEYDVLNPNNRFVNKNISGKFYRHY